MSEQLTNEPYVRCDGEHPEPRCIAAQCWHDDPELHEPVVEAHDTGIDESRTVRAVPEEETSPPTPEMREMMQKMLERDSREPYTGAPGVTRAARDVLAAADDLEAALPSMAAPDPGLGYWHTAVINDPTNPHGVTVVRSRTAERRHRIDGPTGMAPSKMNLTAYCSCGKSWYSGWAHDDASEETYLIWVPAPRLVIRRYEKMWRSGRMAGR